MRIVKKTLPTDRRRVFGEPIFTTTSILTMSPFIQIIKKSLVNLINILIIFVEFKFKIISLTT